MKLHVKKNDEVAVITGKDKGKTGKILKAIPSLGKVVVLGVNVRKVHQKARQAGQKGQVIDKSFPLDASNVKLVKKPDSK